MALLGERTITRRRFAAGGAYDADGKWVAGTPTDTSIRASVQEADAKDLELLELGERTRDPIKVYTVADVRTGDQHSGLEADHLLVDGATYRVLRVGPRHSLIAHVKILAVRLREEAP